MTTTNNSLRVTVDTGGPRDVFVGALLTWLHKPRGGYGYIMPVDAVVLHHARRPKTWVQIEVSTRDGTTARRRVDSSALRWKR